MGSILGVSCGDWLMETAHGKEKFNRSKLHINVGTIGHVNHGKTTLTATLTKMPSDMHAKYIAYDGVVKASTSHGYHDMTKVLTIATSHIEYEMDKFHYAYVNCPATPTR